MERPIRVLLASDTPGHTAGYYVVARGLRDAGLEVIASGYMEPPVAAEAAVQEDVDCIGYRIMDKDPVTLVSSLLEHLERLGAREIPVVVGGIIPRPLHSELERLGVAGIFPPGSRLADIVECIRRNRRPRTVGSGGPRD
ncbi:putative methylmalonyl-CoA mutase large subunit [bacterium HR25]|jgi:methylmalonyl-CoA mutase C-terminal domain/subunit|nr:putative methylmalonyl-CoA mutase large subunit [bacterium HR25]